MYCTGRRFFPCEGCRSTEFDIIPPNKHCTDFASDNLRLFLYVQRLLFKSLVLYKSEAKFSILKTDEAETENAFNKWKNPQWNEIVPDSSVQRNSVQWNSVGILRNFFIVPKINYEFRKILRNSVRYRIPNAKIPPELLFNGKMDSLFRAEEVLNIFLVF